MKTLLPASIECHQPVQDNIMSSLQDEGVTRAAINDPLSMAFTEELYTDHGSEQVVSFCDHNSLQFMWL